MLHTSSTPPNLSSQYCSSHHLSHPYTTLFLITIFMLDSPTCSPMACTTPPHHAYSMLIHSVPVWTRGVTLVVPSCTASQCQDPTSPCTATYCLASPCRIMACLASPCLTMLDHTSPSLTMPRHAPPCLTMPLALPQPYHHMPRPNPLSIMSCGPIRIP